MTAKDILRAAALASGMLLNAVSAQTPLQDRAAQSLGFTNFAHYQRNVNVCAGLAHSYFNSRAPKMWMSLHRFEWSEYKCAAVAAVNRAARPAQCESNHQISKVYKRGELIKLEDGSLWRVDLFDTVKSQSWFPFSDAIICDGKMINEDTNEAVTVTRIQ